MSATPFVLIPTFWTRRRGRGSDRVYNVYDHPTPVDRDGTLPECLASLEGARGLGKVVVVAAATDASVEHEAEDRVREILGRFPGIDAFVLGPAEIGSMHRRLEQLEFADVLNGISLAGYGAVRNAALIVAAVFGSERVVFLDDDQVVTDPEFLTTAMEGLGERTAGGRAILAKSGYYTDEAGDHRAPVSRALTDALWRKNETFNQALTVIKTPPRVRPAPIAFGGCLALHRDMYCNVPFDPWVTRGEDVDYVINVRMHGGDMFLDGDWSVIHNPPAPPSEALAFRQDVYRFIYEHRKLEFSKSQVDLRHVTAESLMPFPGSFVSNSVMWRARVTALLRAFRGKEAKTYLKVARSATSDASRYARENCDRYFAFQRRWPLLMDRLWDDVPLKSLFTGERKVDRSAITGRFPAVRSD